MIILQSCMDPQSYMLLLKMVTRVVTSDSMCNSIPPIGTYSISEYSAVSLPLTLAYSYIIWVDTYPISIPPPPPPSAFAQSLQLAECTKLPSRLTMAVCWTCVCVDKLLFSCCCQPLSSSAASQWICLPSVHSQNCTQCHLVVVRNLSHHAHPTWPNQIRD